jgi:hypothetical protein
MPLVEPTMTYLSGLSFNRFSSQRRVRNPYAELQSSPTVERMPRTPGFCAPAGLRKALAAPFPGLVDAPGEWPVS